MTDAEAIALYRRAFPSDRETRDACEWNEIADEMRRVVEAPDIVAAARVIEWWGLDLGGEGETRKAVVRVRRMAARRKA
jgi:hypothetical protein